MALDLYSVNPYLRVAMQSVLPAGAEIRRRIIFDYELIYLERGRLTFTCGDTDYSCSAGQFLFLRPGIPHAFHGITEDLSQPHLHFDLVYTPKSALTPVSFKDRPDLTPEECALIQPDLFAQYPTTPFVHFSDLQMVLPLFYRIVNRSSASPLEEKSNLLRLIDRLIADNFPDCASNEEPHHDVAQQVKDYIDAGQGLSSRLEDLEKLFSYSKFYLERQFQKHYGISLIAYRNNRRMELARKLLARQSVSVVAEELGFSSIYVFSRAFKQRFGRSPSSFRAEKE